ncbi:AraD1 family protein [Pokkaliibacter sp. CJK22405]|uniref:AraD1 family protein n=1 Tax=Pokkaliibacter sp. CJK22405 TaxID=3384615 RepID=UPI0039856291
MSHLNLVQINTPAGERAALVRDNTLHVLSLGMYDLALKAANQEVSIASLLDSHYTGETLDYDQTIAAGLIRPPITQPNAQNTILSGTGLTHLGSAAPRNKMHAANKQDAAPKTDTAAAPVTKTDTQRMFELGMEGGKGTLSNPGVAPEWFYKGTGDCVSAPFAPLTMPEFSLDAGEEAELAGIYVISDAGKVFRVGYALANEFSDHVTEKQNYLYLAHSKLRNCSFGPEILVGELPEEVTGEVRLSRGDTVLWEHDFRSGEKHMCHSIENLEYHHFKYDHFRKPGQLHVHFFGAAVLSFSEGIRMQAGDEISISCNFMSRPLVNQVGITALSPLSIQSL